MSRDTTRDDDADPGIPRPAPQQQRRNTSLHRRHGMVLDMPKEQRRAATLCNACDWLTSCRNFELAADAAQPNQDSRDNPAPGGKGVAIC